MTVGEVVGKRVQLQPHGVGIEAATRQPRPDDGVLTLLDPLLGGAAAIVEGNDPLRWAGQVGDDEADPGIELARMPLDLGNDPAGVLASSSLGSGSGIGAAAASARGSGRRPAPTTSSSPRRCGRCPPQKAALEVAELVEAEERVVAGAAEVTL
jgi:hypothetical protein